MEQILESIKYYLSSVDIEYILEIFLIYIVIYTFLRFMEGTRGEGILKGIALIFLTVPIVVSFVASRMQIFERLEVIVRFFGAAAIPALVIIVQPELRRALVRLGQTRFFGFLLKQETEGIVDEIVRATSRMAKSKVGALIAIEREVGLKNYIERGTQIDAVVSSQLLATVFFPGSELHDGAVIIRNNRLAAAGCLFPLSDNPELGQAFGTRHRAGLGITEETDAIVVIVSEETGTVSFAHDSELERPLTPDQLREVLIKFYAQLEERTLQGKREELEEPIDGELLTGPSEGKDAETSAARTTQSKEKAEV
jgi:diadenylate cyclase